LIDVLVTLLQQANPYKNVDELEQGWAINLSWGPLWVCRV